MKIKNIFTYCLVSSLFLFLLLSVWKILVTLQGTNLQNFNFNEIFIFGIIICILNFLIGKKINLNLKIISLSLIITIFDYIISIKLPIWYNLGIFLLSVFFCYLIKNYDKAYLSNTYSSQQLFFNFLTLFGITLFSFVILFPFYMMLVTSLKTQALLLINPLDFSVNLAQGLPELFKSYFIVFKDYNFGRYMLTSTVVSLGTVIITLIFAIPAAYAVARLNFLEKNLLSGLFLYLC